MPLFRSFNGVIFYSKALRKALSSQLREPKSICIHVLKHNGSMHCVDTLAAQQDCRENSIVG